jgi:hypothetical protein
MYNFVPGLQVSVPRKNNLSVMLTRPATSRPGLRPDKRQGLDSQGKAKAINININEAFKAKVK